MGEANPRGLQGAHRERPPYVDMVVGPGLAADNQRFGQLLARLREHAGVSRADAAEALGVTSEYLRLIERGKRTPALGQMRSFIDAYRANGEVGKLQPGGDTPDLIILDPLDGEPVIVEFKSRIREARRISVNARRSATGRGGVNPPAPIGSGDAVNRAVELGIVVSLLTQADDATIREIRDLLEARAGNGGDTET